MDGFAWWCSNLAGIRGPEESLCFLIYRFLGPFPGMSELGGLEWAREYIDLSCVFTGLHRFTVMKPCVRNPWLGKQRSEMKCGQSSESSPWATLSLARGAPWLSLTKATLV